MSRRCSGARLLPLLIVFSGCATAIAPGCPKTGLTATAPSNFGVVVANAVFRGARLTTCNQLAFLEEKGITHILQLNASKTQAAVGPHREGSFEVMPVALNALTVGRPSTCGEVRIALRYLEDPKHWPVYVHCTVGRDRTGYIIGMFERETLGRPIDSVMQELGAFGHTGHWSVVFGQIDRELARKTPVCSAPDAPR
jgi:hypothetical protein